MALRARFAVLFLAAPTIAMLLWLASAGHFGRPADAGTHTEVPVPAVEVSFRKQRQELVRPQQSDTQILFGDFHVHTTLSGDAAIMGMAALVGEGARSVGAACDFARYCFALDFCSINDHAEQLTPRLWRETVEAVRSCNAVNVDPENPDTVAFLGWEWSQMGDSPENHYGHRNVIFAGTADDEVPSRAIASRTPNGIEFRQLAKIMR